ncbi:MAG TPA: hypothetical protein VLG09_02865 [Candidatus Saccharimonadales bacterium]|nr:hypothetical protein [Candidatus Saccharimonadales bacterium]
MIDLELNPSRLTDDDAIAIERARSLARRAHSGDVHLDAPRSVQDALKERWYEEGYKIVMTFVDDDCNPIVVSRLYDMDMYGDTGEVRQDRDVKYRFFIDGDTKDIVIPWQLTGGLKSLFSKDEDYTFYDLSDKGNFMAALEGGEKVAADLAWLYERLGQTLTSHVGSEESGTPYLASEQGILGVRLDTFPDHRRRKLFTTPY